MNNDIFSSFDESELSEEDLAIIRAFDSLEHITIKENTSTNPHAGIQESAEPYDSHVDDDIDEDTEMLMIFLEEAEEDISRMRQALAQIRQEAYPDAAQFQLFQRAGHKLRGTAGAVGYMAMSTVAQHIETIASQVTGSHIASSQGQDSIAQALTVLDRCLENLAQDGKESDDTSFLTALEQSFTALGIDLAHPQQSQYRQPLQGPELLLDDETESTTGEAEEAENKPVRFAPATGENAVKAPFLRIESRRIENLLHHTEQLIEQHAPIEDAQRSLSMALQDLQLAQARLQQLEQSLSQSVLNDDIEIAPSEDNAPKVRTSSSLIARILSSAESSTKLRQHTKSRGQIGGRSGQGGQTQEGEWDTLDIEHYTEQDLLFQALRETIVEVSRCTSRAMLAHTALQMAQQEYVEKVSLVSKDAQMIRLAPFQTLVPRMRQVIEMSALAQKHEVTFTIKGERIEIDQEILEILAQPLLKMLRTCIADPGILETEDRQHCDIWLQVSKNGSEVTIEISFSMSVQGGAIEIMHDTMQRLHGSIHFPRTAENDIRFVLRFPGSQGPTHCLLVRTGELQLLIPVNQILRVGVMEYEQLNQTYQLHELLHVQDTSQESAEQQRFQPLLIIEHPISHESVGILVDEVESETEMVIKPLKAYLQRPGITGSAVDGHGTILLALNLSGLLLHHIQQAAEMGTHQPLKGNDANRAREQYSTQQKPRILLADDSAYLRQTIRKMLPEQRYEVAETRDGREAMVQLLENTPDIFLLDIEMPNLNGYDLLTLMQEYPEILHVKTIMLTSRVSEKHRQRAMELGARDYLTKPCTQDVLLDTIERLLQQEDHSHGLRRSYALN